jgi:signal transduction histidine kinase
MGPDSPDPRILGQLLVMQNCIPLVDTRDQLLSMVSRCLDRVPGVAASHLHLGEPGSEAGTTRMTIETVRERFGCLEVTVGDAEAFALYEPFLRNLLGVVALWMENQARQRQLQATMAQLERAVREREAVLALVSHDLASPLGAIVNAAQLLRDEPDRAERVTASARLIERSAGRMTRMIRDLLDLANIDSGQFSIVPAPCDLKRVLREAMDEFRGAAGNKQVELAVELDETLPEILGDGQRLAQVLSNLIGNACKFTARGGRVTVSATGTAGGVLVRVRDTGPGIEPQDLPHLFDRFYRAKGQRQAGSGLGLAIARAIVDGHGGRIGVESCPGEGASFWFTLPDRPPGPPVLGIK